MARPPATPWPTAPGSVFFGDVTSAASLSRAAKSGRIRRLARGVFSADLTTQPEQLIARNRWTVVARLVPDALIADRSAAEGGMPSAGILTVVSSARQNDLVLPGLVVAPRPGSGPLDADLRWLPASGPRRRPAPWSTTWPSPAAGPARWLETSRGTNSRIGSSARAQRRPEGWLAHLRTRALEVCDELGRTGHRPLVEDILGAAAGTRAVRAGAGRLLTAKAAGHEYDPARVERFDELARFLAAIPDDLDVPGKLAAQPDDTTTSPPFFEAY